jgi:hypothetical protein
MPHFNDLVNLARAQRHDDDDGHEDGVVAGGTLALPLPPGSTATNPFK